MDLDNSRSCAHVDTVAADLTSSVASNQHWALRDLYTRILTGELLNPADACELLHSYIEDGELKGFPPAIAAALDINTDDAVNVTVRSLWNAAYDTARAWEFDETDTDRFYQAVLDLDDESSIEVLVFSSIFDGEPRPGLRGTAALASDAWRSFDSGSRTSMNLVLDAHDPSLCLTAMAIEVAGVFNAAGLKARVNEDLTVTVTARWRHHVMPYVEARASADLLPEY